jgi:CubicO group peptidase (beta-lactamase class C family)
MVTKTDKYLNKFVASQTAGDVKVLVQAPGFEYRFESENALPMHFIASSTKLYTNTLIFKLIDNGQLKLNTVVADVLGRETLVGLTKPGNESVITIEHLLTHTSGIADYFGDKIPGGKSLFDDIVAKDRGWTYEELLERARAVGIHSEPGKNAHYSDTNYQLLGRVFETISGSSYATALSELITRPLGLEKTFVLTGSEDLTNVSIMLYGESALDIPAAMASTGCDGGIVSTTDETMKFLKAYYDGSLFNPDFSDPAKQNWRKIFPPIKYGLGQMKVSLPSFMTGFRSVNPLYGHSGASGHVMFFDPISSTRYVATVNQTKDRSLVFKLLINLQIRLRDV